MANILSVGIDIGTSTTQLVFSQISMENTTSYFAVPRISIVKKDVIYTSPVYITPLKTRTLIDGDAVRSIVEDEYRKAGYKPSDVDTGAVIITGESARKENSAEVLEKLSSFAGEFVVSTAGPDIESVIAGKGSGAYQYSIDNGCVTANLDIGGGTTNIVLFDNGDIVAKGCFDIGGRLIRLHNDFTVDYISPAAKAVAESIGVAIDTGLVISPDNIKKITDKMADLLAQALGIKPKEALLGRVKTPGSSDLDVSRYRISRICFSGGVADCMNYVGSEMIPYGDIGIFLGKSLNEGQLVKSIKPLSGDETIRATVVGAGSYTTSISGSTISYVRGVLPIKNTPALKLTESEEEQLFSGKQGLLSEKIRWFLSQSDSENLVLALTGKHNPEYEELKILAHILANEMDESLPLGAPMLICFENDEAKAMGIFLNNELKGRRELICIDSVKIQQGDYVDMGKPVMGGLVIPVVVKTLLFG